MGTTSEWLRVLELGVFWGLGVFLWEAIAGRKSLASVSNLVLLAVTGLLFGMFVVFEWRVIHGALAIVFTLAIVELLVVALAERRSRRHVEESAQADSKALVHNEALANLAEAQKLSRTGSFDWNVLTGEITWSDESFRIFEYPSAQTPTMELVMARIHPADRALVQQTIDRASTERPHFDVEHRLLMPDGVVKYLHVVARAVETSSGHLRFAGAITDISDRKRAEEALRRSEGYLAEAQRLTRSGSWAWNVRSGALFWSLEIFRIYDYDPEKMTPTWADFLARVHPEDRPGIEQRAKMESTQKHWEVSEADFRIVLPGGAIKHLHSIAHPVWDEAGELTEVVGTVMDVTERMRADEERERLREAQADLAHVNRVTTMGELTASLAHEIKQPIAAVLLNAHACLRWLNREQPEVAEARETASRIIRDITRTSDIISRTRLLFKKAPPQRELLDVNEVIQEMIVLLHNEASRSSISIHDDLATGLPRIMADRVQLQQVFMNLMLNGIEAMRDNTSAGRLTIKSQHGENRQLLISVVDTGVGIQPEQEQQIFQAFFSTKSHGTGMGLPISRSIIESHGGRLWAAGNGGPGASFHFTLPIDVGSPEMQDRTEG